MEPKDQTQQPPATPAPAASAKFPVSATSLRQSEALAALVGERAYQDLVWNKTTTITEGKHSVTEFLVYVRDYAEQSLHDLSRSAEQASGERALHELRKIGALAVAALEQNGIRERSKADVDKATAKLGKK